MTSKTMTLAVILVTDRARGVRAAARRVRMRPREP